MKITLLGTGTSQGIPVIGCECHTCLSEDEKDKRLRVSCMLEIDDKRIVIDIGPDFRQQMLRSGGKEIHAVIITHEHNDHVAGLDDVRPFNFRYEKDMPVFALPRVNEQLRHVFPYIFQEHVYPGAPQVKLFDIENDAFQVEGIKIIPIRILHGELPILGFRIKDFAYLTDVKTIPETEFPKLQDLEVLILSALHHEEHHSHITIEEAISMAKKIGAKKTYFTHFSHNAGTHKEISTLLPKGIEAGYDGLEILL